MRYFCFLLVMIASLLPQQGYAWKKSDAKLEPEEVYFNKYQKLIEKKRGWRIAGLRFGLTRKVLTEVGYGIEVKGPLTEEEMRRQVVWLVKEMVNGLNAMPELLAKVETPPATEKIVNLSLSFVDKKGNTLLSPEISVLSVHSGKLHYNKHIMLYNEKQKTNYYKIDHTKVETFDEALQILGLTREELKDWDGEIKTPISN